MLCSKAGKTALEIHNVMCMRVSAVVMHRSETKFQEWFRRSKDHICRLFKVKRLCWIQEYSDSQNGRAATHCL